MPKIKSIAELNRRKGAVRMADIPLDVLNALNRGTIDARNLVEMLAIDMALLLKHVVSDLGLKSEQKNFLREYSAYQSLGIMDRLRGAAQVLHEQTVGRSDRKMFFKKLSGHPSDTVRSWACFMVSHQTGLSTAQRFDAIEPFAADSHMAVRECAWMTLRPFLMEDFKASRPILKQWAKNENTGVRRCAIESTRPRGVWCKHFELLKSDPAQALEIIQICKSDPERYVQNSVANWLNDAGKSHPGWVKDVCRAWQKESPTPQTQYIVKRGLRTINSQSSK